MRWLNYHHLLYFWTVAREGSVAKACVRLGLAQPTISGQLRALEHSLGSKLFERVGRNLVLTEAGRQAYRYADEIFSLGRQLQEAVRGEGVGRRLRLVAGIGESLPEVMTYKILEPALRLADPVQIVCRRGSPERLAADLAVHDVDVVLADAPLGPGLRVRVFHHLLGECGVSLCASPAVADALGGDFPGCLDGAPFLMPPEGSSLRRSLDEWLTGQGLRPRVLGEFDDASLLKAFGQAGAGVFAVPSASEEENVRKYSVCVLGRVEAAPVRFYLVTAERRLRHPAVAAILEAARDRLFG